MTEYEITKSVKHDNKRIHAAILTTAERVPSIKAKLRNGKIPHCTDFTLEECIEIFKEFGANELELIMLNENYKEHKRKEYDGYRITGTLEFLKKYQANPNIKCCNTCKFLMGVVKDKMPKPYCRVYENFLYTFKARVYEDWCSSYCKCNLPKPRQWFKDSAPINLNMYGETDTINGIEKSRLMNSKRSVPNTIIRVNQVGFDS